jgi:hypothetical protein
MKTPDFVLLVFLSFNCSPASAARPIAHTASAPSQEQATPASPADSKGVVYVSDFELHVMKSGEPLREDDRIPRGSGSAGGPGSSETGLSKVPSSNASGSTSNITAQDRTADGSTARHRVWQETDLPQTRADKLVELMSTSLLRALERAGYTARRWKAGEARPARGVALRGVFAEADEQNHIRLALLGSGSPTTKFLVYWGVQNLASADQPLYEIANPNAPGLQPPEGKAPDNRYGPVITLTSYAPVARFEMDKEPTEEQVQRIVSNIVASLSALLSANPAAVTE